MTNNRINNGDESGGNLEYFDTETRLNALPKPGSCPFSRAWLYDLYWVQKKSCREIGIIAGSAMDRNPFDPSSVARWMNYYDIPKRTNKECVHTYGSIYKATQSARVSEKQKQSAKKSIENARIYMTKEIIRKSQKKGAATKSFLKSRWVKCGFCKNTIKRQLNVIKKSNNSFCSNSCSAKYKNESRRRSRIADGEYIGYKKIPCTYCGVSYWASCKAARHAEKGLRNPFCTRKCQGLYLRRKNQLAKQKAAAESQQVQPVASSTPFDNITDPTDPENLTEGIL